MGLVCGWFRWSFAEIVGVRKPESLGVVCVTLLLAISVEFQLLTNRRTDGRTGRQTHDHSIYRASIASCGKHHYANKTKLLILRRNVIFTHGEKTPVIRSLRNFGGGFPAPEIVAWATYFHHYKRQAQIIITTHRYIDDTTLTEIFFPGQSSQIEEYMNELLAISVEVIIRHSRES